MLQQRDGAIHGREDFIIQARSVYRQHNGDGGRRARRSTPVPITRQARTRGGSLQAPLTDPIQVTEARLDTVLGSVVFQQVSGELCNTRDRSSP